MQYTLNKQNIKYLTIIVFSITSLIFLLFNVINNLSSVLINLNSFSFVNNSLSLTLNTHILGILIYLGFFGIFNSLFKKDIFYSILFSSILTFLFIYFNFSTHFDKYMLFPPESEDLNIKEVLRFMPYQPYLFLPLTIFIITCINLYFIKQNKKIINIFLFLCYFIFLNANNYLSEKSVISYTAESTKNDIITFYKNGTTEKFCSVYGIYCFTKENKYIFGNMKDYKVRDEIKKFIDNNEKLNSIVSINNNKIIYLKKDNTNIFITDFYIKELNISIFYSSLLNIFIGIIIFLIGGYCAIKSHNRLT